LRGDLVRGSRCKRIVRRGSGKTKTEARVKLKQVLRDHEDGLTISAPKFTVADAMTPSTNGWNTDSTDGHRER